MIDRKRGDGDGADLPGQVGAQLPDQGVARAGTGTDSIWLVERR